MASLTVCLDPQQCQTPHDCGAGIELVRIFVCAGSGTRDTPENILAWKQRPKPWAGLAKLVHSRVMLASFTCSVSSPVFGCAVQFR